MDDAENLARYMKIIRPKIENAWIGARWSNKKHLYEFVDEHIELANTTCRYTGYPPWRNGRIQKTKGCLVLDEHWRSERDTLVAHFVETRCERFRPYICYKSVNKIKLHISDGRNRFNPPKPWRAAKEWCESRNGKLPEPKSEKEIKELVYIMGENYTAVHQIWLGGLYHSDQKWRWVSNNEVITINGEYPPWLINKTYTRDVEDKNTCLNLDRENHNSITFYGTDCSYPQSFTCTFGE